MKRGLRIQLFLLLIIFLLLTIVLSLSVPKINAADMTPSPTIVGGFSPEKMESVSVAIQNITTDESARTAYLTQSWNTILEKYRLGRLILKIDYLLNALSPVIKILVGTPYSGTWFFWLVFLLWFAVVKMIYNSVKDLFNSNATVALGIALIIPAIGAQFKAFEKVVTFFIPLFSKSWMIYVALVVGFLVVYLYTEITKSIHGYIKEKKDKEDKERQKLIADTTEKLDKLKIKAAGGRA